MKPSDFVLGLYYFWNSEGGPPLHPELAEIDEEDIEEGEPIKEILSLLEAVEKSVEDDLESVQMYDMFDDAHRILYAALALKEVK